MSDEKGRDLRQILSLSGGKDSTALAIYLKDRIDCLEYVFCDTGEELPETYEYIDRLEILLGKQVVRLNPDRPFNHYLHIYRGVLPDARTRWCTRTLKIEPFEKYVGGDFCINYIGIRADEVNRKGYISTKPNITPRYPFIENNIKKADVIRILEESGLGLPKYYDWRSRSGCYFCFFQQKIEWVGLLENHPELFKKALDYEKNNPETGEFYTWAQGESLKELKSPNRIEVIKTEKKKRLEQQLNKFKSHLTLAEVLTLEDNSQETDGCLICHL
jgi:hypothetical protein